MARLQKLTRREIPNLLRHNDRTIKTKREHLDPARAHLNRRLSPDRQGREYDCFKNRIKSIEIGRDRADRVYCVEWIVTAPKNIEPSEVNRFFDVCYSHLCEKYGGEHNVISAYQHGDEQGEPHMHFDFLPLVKTADGRDRLNAKILLDKNHLKSWHNELDAVLTSAGLPPTQNGITAKNGRNYTVKELKRTPEQERSDRALTLKFNMKKPEIEKQKGVYLRDR